MAAPPRESKAQVPVGRLAKPSLPILRKRVGNPFYRARTPAILVLLSLAGVATAGEGPKVRIQIDNETPAESRCLVPGPGGDSLEFPVGYGRSGALPEGSEFKGGYSLLGKFRINAILSAERFEMTPELVASSGKTEAYLRESLFANMSSIDFDGDGKGGEYGAAFIGLEPLSDTEQPFAFEPYKGIFRWYSYAIHGTQDESRVGKKITGGCINVGAKDLQQLLKLVRVGDLVEIRSATASED